MIYGLGPRIPGIELEPRTTASRRLPLDKPVVLAFTPTKSGELRYGCSMDLMVSGVLMVE